MASYTKRQGESLALKKGLRIDGEEVSFDTGWTCKFALKLATDGLSGTNKLAGDVTDKTPDNLRFIPKITPAQMATLEPERYLLVTQIENTTLEINHEFHDTLTVKAQGIS